MVWKLTKINLLKEIYLDNCYEIMHIIEANTDRHQLFDDAMSLKSLREMQSTKMKPTKIIRLIALQN